jgi:hypothetical protein
MRTLAATILVFLFNFNHSASALSWLRHACARILNSEEYQANSSRLQHISRLMELQLQHSNRFTSYPIRPSIEPLSFISDNPESIILRPSLKGLHKNEPNILAFVNPELAAADWTEDHQGLCKAPSLLLLIENLPVRNDRGESVSLADLLTAEAGQIHDRNPELHFQLRSSVASDFKGLKFSSEAREHLVFWVEGDLQNFQVERIIFLAMEQAFENYVRSYHPH